MSEYNAKNYTEQSGDVTHISGKLVIEDGATVEGLPGGTSYELPVATNESLGGVMVGSGLSVTESGELSVSGDSNIEILRIMVNGTTAENNVNVVFPGSYRTEMRLPVSGNLERFYYVYYGNGLQATFVGLGSDDRAYFHTYCDLDGESPKEIIIGLACAFGDQPTDIVYFRDLSVS